MEPVIIKGVKCKIPSVQKRNYKCNKCENGVVVLTIKQSKENSTVSISCCNNKDCGEYYGIKSLGSLKEII